MSHGGKLTGIEQRKRWQLPTSRVRCGTSEMGLTKRWLGSHRDHALYLIKKVVDRRRNQRLEGGFLGGGGRRVVFYLWEGERRISSPLEPGGKSFKDSPGEFVFLGAWELAEVVPWALLEWGQGLWLKDLHPQLESHFRYPWWVIWIFWEADAERELEGKLLY